MDIRLNGIGWRKDHVVSAKVPVTLQIDCPLCQDQDVEFTLRLFPEAFTNKIGGDIQERPEEMNMEVVSRDASSVTFVSPAASGAYRVFAFVQNAHHQVSVANVPFLVE